MGRIPKDAYAMIIGAMKCGTTSLYNYLVKHPAVCPCITKEPGFFSENQAYSAGIKYEDLWTFDPKVHLYALEASTGYAKYPEKPDVPRKILEYGLRPRFIYIVRNPFDRIISQYQHHVQKLPGFDPSTPLTWDLFVNFSNYFLQLQQYRPYFLREMILILDFDELKSSPRECTLKVCRFLGIRDIDVPNSYSVDHRTIHKAEALTATVARNPVLRFLATASPKPARRLIKRVAGRVLRERVFSERERESVRSLLTRDMIRFREEYGFDIRKWGW